MKNAFDSIRSSDLLVFLAVFLRVEDFSFAVNTTDHWPHGEHEVHHLMLRSTARPMLAGRNRKDAGEHQLVHFPFGGGRASFRFASVKHQATDVLQHQLHVLSSLCNNLKPTRFTVFHNLLKIANFRMFPQT